MSQGDVREESGGSLTIAHVDSLNGNEQQCTQQGEEETRQERERRERERIEERVAQEAEKAIQLNCDNSLLLTVLLVLVFVCSG